MEKTLNYEDDPFASLDVEEDVMGEFERWSWNEGKIPWKLWHGGWKLVDIDFEILVTSTSSDADIIAEESGHVDINNEKESDAEEQPTDCISGPAFKYVMNATLVLKSTTCFQTLEQIWRRLSRTQIWTAYLIRFFPNFVKYFNKKKRKKELVVNLSNSNFNLSLPPLEIRIRATFLNSSLFLMRT